MKIILIGFMGAGKSSVAPLLAKKLHHEVIEMDEKIIKKSGLSSIKDIFAKKTEKGFRQLEEEVAKSLRYKDDIVISAGGGVIGNEKTIKHLKHNGIIIFLETSFETILKRLVDISDRPLWKDSKKTKELYEKRLPLYKEYATISVTTDNKSLGQVTDEIIDQIEKL